MNRILLIVGLSFVMMISSNCQSGKKLNSPSLTAKNHFTVSNATYTKWIGGQPGVNGYLVSFTIDNTAIQPDTLYFRNMKTLVKFQEDNSGTTFAASFMLPKKADFILDENPIKEFQNTAPILTKNIPFDLKPDQAVIHYLFKGKSFYRIIENLQEVKNQEKS